MNAFDQDINDTLDAHEMMDESVRTAVCCGDCGRAITDTDTSEPGTYYCEDCLTDDFYDC